MNETARILGQVLVQGDDECWPWQGPLNDGYGHAYYKGRAVRSHRAVFELLGGRVKPGLEIDHLCRNRACVNPQHLDPVTRLENIRRSPIMWHALQAQSPTCPNGHLYEGNMRRVMMRGRSVRRCLTCERARRDKDNQIRRVRRANGEIP